MQEHDSNPKTGPFRVDPGRLLRLGLLVLLATLASGPGFADVVVKQVSGQVEIQGGHADVWSPARQGDRIEPNGRVRTGSDGRVEIVMDVATIRVHENSLLRIPAASGPIDQVELEQGHSLFDVLHRAGSRFEVQTPTVVVSVKGTRFGVETAGETGEVSVYRGVVGVRRAGDEDVVETLVREGFLATGGVDRPIELDVVAPGTDPWADWEKARDQAESTRSLPAATNEVDRAKASLHRATDDAVLERAARRKPEVAERLRALRKSGSGEGESVVPAAPAPGDDLGALDAAAGLLDRTIVDTSGALDGSGALSAGSTSLEQLQQQTTQEVESIGGTVGLGDAVGTVLDTVPTVGTDAVEDAGQLIEESQDRILKPIQLGH